MTKATVKLSDLPEAAVAELWARFNAVVRVLADADRLGTVLFQFPSGFIPDDEGIAHVEYCRARLDADFPMAVDFRDRRWFGYKSANGLGPEDAAAAATGPPPHENGGGSESTVLHQTLALCKRLKLGFVSSDDLKHEFVGKDEPDALEGPVIMPTHTFVPHPEYAYVRVHRRAGMQRVLSASEVQAWVERVKRLCAQTQGPVYFMWATDHEYQPIQNADNLMAVLRPLGLAFDWTAHVRRVSKSSQEKLTCFFKAARSPTPASSTSVGSGGASEVVEAAGAGSSPLPVSSLQRPSPDGDAIAAAPSSIAVEQDAGEDSVEWVPVSPKREADLIVIEDDDGDAVVTPAAPTPSHAPAAAQAAAGSWPASGKAPQGSPVYAKPHGNSASASGSGSTSSTSASKKRKAEADARGDARGTKSLLSFFQKA